MGWMIRNDGKAFKVVDRVVLKDETNERDDMIAMIWLYDHTGCLLVRYSVLRLLTLMARKANPYIIPSEYYRGLSVSNRKMNRMKKWLPDHGRLLDTVYRELWKNDESITEYCHLPLAYSEEISYRRKILSYQLNQEFLYANFFQTNTKENTRLDIEDDSVLFDWSGIINEFSKQLGSEYNVRIRRLGSRYETLERIAFIAEQSIKEHDCQGKPEEQLKYGRSLLQIVNEKPYSQERILQRLEWIRRRERRRMELSVG